MVDVSRRYFDRAGLPITVQQWSVLHGDTSYRVVASTEVGDATVSTVWLGLDHGMGRGPGPVIFETMVFGGEHDLETWRYTTLADAEAGHDEVVALLKGVEELAPSPWWS